MARKVSEPGGVSAPGPALRNSVRNRIFALLAQKDKQDRLEETHEEVTIISPSTARDIQDAALRSLGVVPDSHQKAVNRALKR